MKNRGWTWPSIVLGVGLMLLAACGTTGDSGDSSNSSTATCDTACADNYTANGIINTVAFLYNQNIAGKATSSAWNLDVACAQGGTVNITGSNSYSSSTLLNTVNLVFAMGDCRYQETNFDLTQTGSVTWSGTFISFVNINSLSYKSDALSYSGTVSSAAPTAVAGGSCVVGLSSTSSGVAGTVCERSVSY